MSLPRFFLENQVLAAQTEPVFALDLSDDDARHARVLRLAPGEHIAVVDAEADYFECEVVSVQHGLQVRIASRAGAAPRRPRVVLLQGISKGDKMDEVIRHATELGVCAFVPLACARSVVKLDAKKAEKRVARWRAIAKSAAMQSGQPAIPRVDAPQTPARAAALSGCTAVIVCWEESSGLGIGAALARALEETNTAPQDAQVAVVIGPEGGLERREVETFLASNAHSYSVTLGPSILRTETAGVVAPALVLYELGVLR